MLVLQNMFLGFFLNFIFNWSSALRKCGAYILLYVALQMVLCVIVVGSTTLEQMDCHFKSASKDFLISHTDEGKNMAFVIFTLINRTIFA